MENTKIINLTQLYTVKDISKLLGFGLIATRAFCNKHKFMMIGKQYFVMGYDLQNCLLMEHKDK